MKCKDPKKRAELLIEAAKKVLGDKESIFVTPDDIVGVIECENWY